MDDLTTTDMDLASIDPDSPEFAAMLEKVMKAEEGDTETNQDEIRATSGAVPGKGNDDQAQGILAADGKHIIPIDVLRNARAAEAQARQTAANAMAELEALKARLAAGADGDGDEIEVDIETSDAIDEQLATLAEDYPELGNFAKALTAQLKETRKLVQDLVADKQATAATEQTQRQLTIREAIDSNPTLLLWENDTEDREAWSRAVQYDKLLRERPDWADKPVQERFAQVVKLVQVDYPTAKKPAGTSPKTGADLTAKAREALANAGDLEIESLSQIPSGASPTETELGDLSATQIESMMSNMSQKQIDALLLRRL